ncbi:Hydantoinase B/oxoprolinase [Exidia glandulosa HHB12029]|uniref:Hydantoinase B/oxoprolinase n=1 Tax=Exidia glandulosa HHB12029 TaxID=1314781 RepID=A0A165NQQ6_EXIGL|nr:Hydantoinase B/oxoprolinase [Exidia glandulosa HHB12029]
MAATQGDASRGSQADPILLTLFANRFMSVAEAMGRTLQQTAISTNIKERLDFSCALFAPDGDLVANAPFIPIHLGSMSFAVRYQMKLHKGNIKPGDVFMTNSPLAGGSHLPDITIITPVFDPDDDNKIIFFTASRGHHADIGGILPGSMPPTSTTIFEEGASIVSFKLVKEGEFDRDGLYERMVTRPAQYEGSSGCRCFRDVESDLRAQIAANHKGIQLIHNMIREYGLPTVQEYMLHIRSNAEQSVRTFLKRIAATHSTTLNSIDYLDDGSPIRLKVDINKDTGAATFDFSGTGAEVRGNLNAPISVVHSAVIYCLRAMLDSDIPLNAGCLVPVKVIIPSNSLLAPSPTAAVCGGNVLTSQRIVDVVLKAFDACAASQGCTNNLTFGAGGKDAEGKVVAGWGYYETIAGGSGAGEGWHGTSGVHTHITNTRIGDVEILERRYPVLLHEFGLRPGSGGAGKYRGGDGVRRVLEVSMPMRVSILSERRTRAPYGLYGGHDGAMGRNTWIKCEPSHSDPSAQPTSSSDEPAAPDLQKLGKTPEELELDDIPVPDRAAREINIGGKATLWMGKGDRLVIETPGGGGWGTPEEGDEGFVDESVQAGDGRAAWEARGSLAERARAQAEF